MRTARLKKLYPLFERRSSLVLPYRLIPVHDADNRPIFFADGSQWQEVVFDGVEYGSDEHMRLRQLYMDSLPLGVGGDEPGELPLSKAQTMVHAGFTLYNADTGEEIEVPL